MPLDRRRVIHKRNRFRQLRMFCDAARLGSIAKAAEHSGLSPPAVWLQMRELEDELRESLFERGSSANSLTAAGEKLYQLVKPLIEQMEGLFDDFAENIDGDVSGRLAIATSGAGAATVLPPYIRRFRDHYPDVRMRVRNCILDEGIRLLRAGEVEFVLGAHEPDLDRAFEYREMLSCDIVLITALDHPLAGRETATPSEAAAWSAIMPPPGAYGLQSEETAARHFGLDAMAMIEVGGWGVIKRYVERGLGVCVVPSICIHETDQVSVIPLKYYFPARSFGVYTRLGKPLTVPAQRMLALLIPDPRIPSSGMRRTRAGLAEETLSAPGSAQGELDR